MIAGNNIVELAVEMSKNTAYGLVDFFADYESITCTRFAGAFEGVNIRCQFCVLDEVVETVNRFSAAFYEENDDE